MTPDEQNRIVRIGACVGIPLSPSHILTAYHCSRFPRMGMRAGWTLLTQEEDKFIIEEELENSPTEQADYAIFKIRWEKGEPPKNLRYVTQVATQDSLTLGHDSVATPLIAFGMPADRYARPTYSEGFAKAYDNGTGFLRLKVNIGLTSGNSGGPIFRKDNGELVAIVTGGPHPYWDEKGKNRELEDPTAWNHGSALYEIYRGSKVLQDLFPGGANRFLLEQDSQEFSASASPFSHARTEVTSGRR